MTHHDPRSGNLGAGSAPGARPTDGSLNAPQPVIHDAAPVRSGSQARQATPGRPVLYVLIAGIVLALVAWVAVGLYPSAPQVAAPASTEPRITGTTRAPNAGGIPLSPPAGSPEGGASSGQTSPDAAGRGRTSAPSPTSDSAR